MSCCAPSEAATTDAGTRWREVVPRRGGWYALRFPTAVIVKQKLHPAGTVAVRNHDMDVFQLLTAEEFAALFEEISDAG